MPWGDSFISGFSAGVDMRDKKKRAQLEEADQSLRREMQQKQLDAEVQRMHDGFAFQSVEGAKERGWRTGERTGAEGFTGGQNALNRGQQTSERLGAEGFQGTQSDLDRAARATALDRQLRQETTLAGAKQTFDQSKFDWEKDPTNPSNQVNVAHAGYLARGGGPPEPPDGASALNNGMKAQDGIPTLSPADAANAKPGTRYRTTDGRVMIR